MSGRYFKDNKQSKILVFIKRSINFLTLAVITLSLSGCIAPQTERFLTTSTNTEHLIENVPFYPQQEFFCGPTTIAEVLNFYGESIKPTDIAPSLFIPGRNGSLQVEMASSIRQLGYIAYQDQLNLTELISIVEKDVPVIILQNNGLSWYPRWHYAVVIGYEKASQSLIMHTGLTANRKVDMSLFERTWKRAKQWAIVPMPVSRAPTGLNEISYLQAAQDLIAVNKGADGIVALTTAYNHWKESYLPALLLANHYIESEPNRAREWYKKAFKLAPNNAPLLNNYAYTLGKLGCKNTAKQLIQQAIDAEPNNENYKNTLNTIRSMIPNAKRIEECSL